MNHYIDLKIIPDAEISLNFIRNKIVTKLHKALHDLSQNRIGISFPNWTDRQSRRSEAMLEGRENDPEGASKRQKSGGVYLTNNLGNTLRLHGSQADLQTLQDTNWLGGLSGYCEVSDILPVPENIKGYRTVSRIQPGRSMAKLRRHIVHQKAQGILKTDEEIAAYEKQYKAKMFASSLDNPYLELQSVSTGEHYRIFIQFGELQDQPVAGAFNCYGLSSRNPDKQATVPWF